ncbi:hypothetical protein BDR03DRAFT_936643 [Suillus americanus]|nr:hypothetical protein BDR03DRAFT_936643 [Suillus americanus]
MQCTLSLHDQLVHISMLSQKTTPLMGSYYIPHPILNGSPCDAAGSFLHEDHPPIPAPPPPADDAWDPFASHGHFKLVDFIFWQNQMAGKQVDELMQVLGSFEELKGCPPFHSDHHIYDTIDTISSGAVHWQSLTLIPLTLSLQNLLPGDPTVAPWKSTKYEVWYCDPHELVIDYSARQVFGEQGQHVWSNFMTRNWAWNQSNTLANDPDCHGAMFVPVILGSDKTTVSMATGQNDFYPLYISTGNLHNNAHHAHKESVSLVGFLSIPQTERDHDMTDEFRGFRQHIFHASLKAILETFRHTMEKPEVAKCADGHYQHAVYGLVVINFWLLRCTADRAHLDKLPSGGRSHQHTKILMHGYSGTQLKQGWGIINGILPFTVYFPCADIHELLAHDILHQIIKGTFKDHIMAWVEQIWADIDCRIAVVPSFPGLRCFPQRQRFKQWTGNDLKALMKIILPAIAGHVSEKMIRAIHYFLDFCYIVHRSSLNENDLASLQIALQGFYNEHTMFIDQFGAPNGLCSSLTESKHIKVVKEPWQHSNGCLPLGQILVTNQRLDKLASFQAEKFAIGLLDQPLLPPGVAPIDPDTNHHDPDFFLYRDDQDMEDAVVDEGDEEAEVIVQLAKRQAPGYPQRAWAIGEMIGIPSFHDLVCQFLHDQRNPDHTIPGCDMDISQCPDFNGKVDIFHSAVVSFYTASNICGVNSMLCHTIHVARSWRGDQARHDCIFIEHNLTIPGFQGLYVAQVILLFSFTFQGVDYPCALIHWFSTIGNQPCPNTAHLIPIYGSRFLDRDLIHTDSLIAFGAFYVNKFSDYHAYETAF